MLEPVLYLIRSTDDSTRLAIYPRTVDGQGGNQWNSPLVLYGNGATFWGERFNENFYRSMEHFACPEKTLENSETFVPGMIQPTDEGDLAPGHGVNHPLPGMMWFNTTRNAFFVYSKVEGSSSPEEYHWTPLTSIAYVGGSSVTTGLVDNRIGDLAVDQDADVIKLWNGTTWIDVGDFGVAGPSPIYSLGPVGTYGSTMSITDVSDSLSPSSGQVLKFSGSQWTQGTDELGIGGGGGGTGTVYEIVGTMSVSGSISASGSLSLINDSSSPGPSLYYGTNSGGSRGFHSFPSVSGPTGITDHGAATGLADDDHPLYVNVSGDTMTGSLNQGNNRIINLASPSAAQDLATKQYVDSKFSSGVQLLLMGSVASGSTVSYPSGYNDTNTLMLFSLNTVNQPGGASLDFIEVYPSSNPFGFQGNVVWSKENNGSLNNQGIMNYWLYANGPAVPSESGTVNITSRSISGFSYGDSVYVILSNTGVLSIDDGAGPSYPISGEWLITGSASDYQAYAFKTYDGPGTLTGTYDSWVSLSSARQWGLNPPASWTTGSGSITIVIRNANTGAIAGTANYDFTAEGQGSGPIP